MGHLEAFGIMVGGRAGRLGPLSDTRARFGVGLRRAVTGPGLYASSPGYIGAHDGDILRRGWCSIMPCFLIRRKKP